MKLLSREESDKNLFALQDIIKDKIFDETSDRAEFYACLIGNLSIYIPCDLWEKLITESAKRFK
jgi:hypothetical protein